MGEDRICAAPDCANPYRGAAETCEYCGGATVTMRSARINGGVSIVIGLGLAVGMAVLAWILTPLMFDPTGESFNGSRAMAYAILALLSLIGIFGLVGIIFGIRRFRTGRVDLQVRKIMLWLVTPVFVLGGLLELFDEFL
ncbi:MAG: hypothetical protein ACTS1Z_00345 [Parasphingopyxis sp.]|uniref:hypothetical protein n=1 Tax=Parasphingopyxis sp. TaxID=1920299 RepID=UPI003FA12A48